MAKRAMIRWLALPCLLLLLTGAAPRPQRIVSLNLCADQYLLALADRGQIAALTQLARDPQMSAAASRAAGLHLTRGSAEDVLALRPDMVIAAPGYRQQTIARLRERGVVTFELATADDYPAIRGQVRAVAAAIGHPDRGEALIRQMDARLASIPRFAGKGRTAAYYQRRGYLTGTGTLVDDLMRRVGLRNLAARLGKPVLARIGLEQLAQARPDLLIVESESERVTDQGTELLHHPVIGGIPRIRLPQAWTVCGGPAYVDAAAAIADQLR